MRALLAEIHALELLRQTRLARRRLENHRAAGQSVDAICNGKRFLDQLLHKQNGCPSRPQLTRRRQHPVDEHR